MSVHLTKVGVQFDSCGCTFDSCVCRFDSDSRGCTFDSCGHIEKGQYIMRISWHYFPIGSMNREKLGDHINAYITEFELKGKVLEIVKEKILRACRHGHYLMLLTYP